MAFMAKILSWRFRHLNNTFGVTAMYFRCQLSINRVMQIVREQCISMGKIHDLAESYNFPFIFLVF